MDLSRPDQTVSNYGTSQSVGPRLSIHLLGRVLSNQFNIDSEIGWSPILWEEQLVSQKLIMLAFNIEPLKEPRGFIKCLQWIFAIAAFATVTNFSGDFSINVTCNSTSSSEVRLHNEHVINADSPINGLVKWLRRNEIHMVIMTEGEEEQQMRISATPGGGLIPVRQRMLSSRIPFSGLPYDGIPDVAAVSTEVQDSVFIFVCGSSLSIQVEHHLFGRDGASAADMFSLTHPHVASEHLQVPFAGDIVSEKVSPPYDDLVLIHLRCCWALSKHNMEELLKTQSMAVEASTKILQTHRNQNWFLPVTIVLCRDLRRVASMFPSSSDGKKTDTLEKAAELIMGCFRICAADSRTGEDYTKRWGMLGLVNLLLRIYFRTSRMHLCKPLIRAIDASPLKDRFPLSHRITYMYYVGRKAMFDSQFKEAEKYLDFAFLHCHQQCWKNKRLILIYLIPVKMLLGRLPKQSLLHKYQLEEFSSVTEAVRLGDLRSLSESLDRNQGFFISCGIYLILEKLKIITMRNLFKKVYLLCGRHQVEIGAIESMLQWMGMDDVDTAETQCLLANQINDGLIRGYISHQHNKLVVSKQNPFPPLASSISSFWPLRSRDELKLCFRKGDVITVTQEEDGGWWEGTLRGQTGWFPCNYVREYLPQGRGSMKEDAKETDMTLAQKQASHRGLIITELLESEEAFLAQMERLQKELLHPLRDTDILSKEEVSQLVGNLDEVIEQHRELISEVKRIRVSFVPSEERIGKLFLNVAASMRDVHLTYCRHHPNAVAILDKYRDEVNGYLMSVSGGAGGVVHLTSGLSAPFRRLERYATILHELQGHMEDSHFDRGDAQRAADFYRSLSAECNAARRQRELELEILSGNVEGWEGDRVSDLGDILKLGRIKVTVRGATSDRFLALFPNNLILLSTSSSMSTFIYEGSIPLSSASVREFEDPEGNQTMFQISVQDALVQHVEEPSRKEALLDFVFMTNDDMALDVKVQDNFEDLDHSTITWNIKQTKSPLLDTLVITCPTPGERSQWLELLSSRMQESHVAGGPQLTAEAVSPPYLNLTSLYHQLSIHNALPAHLYVNRFRKVFPPLPPPRPLRHSRTISTQTTFEEENPFGFIHYYSPASHLMEPHPILFHSWVRPVTYPTFVAESPKARPNTITSETSSSDTGAIADVDEDSAAEFRDSIFDQKPILHFSTLVIPPRVTVSEIEQCSNLPAAPNSCPLLPAAAQPSTTSQAALKTCNSSNMLSSSLLQAAADSSPHYPDSVHTLKTELGSMQVPILSSCLSKMDLQNPKPVLVSDQSDVSSLQRFGLDLWNYDVPERWASYLALDRTEAFEVNVTNEEIPLEHPLLPDSCAQEDALLLWKVPSWQPFAPLPWGSWASSFKHDSGLADVSRTTSTDAVSQENPDAAEQMTPDSDPAQSQADNTDLQKAMHLSVVELKPVYRSQLYAHWFCSRDLVLSCDSDSGKDDSFMDWEWSDASVVAPGSGESRHASVPIFPVTRNAMSVATPPGGTFPIPRPHGPLRPSILIQGDNYHRKVTKNDELEHVFLQIIKEYLPTQLHVGSGTSTERPPLLIAEEEKIFIDDGTGIQERSLVDTVYGLKDRLESVEMQLSHIIQVLKDNFPQIGKAMPSLDSLIKSWVCENTKIGRKMKYILVTGGVISGIGKGVIASSIGTILKSYGLHVTSIKIDPYINIDAGTFSPYEHGEVFVLADGGEVDLDLGNYERFMDVTLHRDNNITTGKIYQWVIEKERRGDYLGKTVQVVPHVTEAIQEWVERVSHTPVTEDGQQPEVCIIELGGTIGDIEGMPFVEAFRQFEFRIRKENFCCVHVSLVPKRNLQLLRCSEHWYANGTFKIVPPLFEQLYTIHGVEANNSVPLVYALLGDEERNPKSTGEPKTKPTQASVRELRRLGLSPDVIVCRSEHPIDISVKEKISNLCHVPVQQVVSITDYSSIYRVPLALQEEKVASYLLQHLQMEPTPSVHNFIRQWRNLADRVEHLRKEVSIALVGKYTQLEDAYISVTKALQHAALWLDRKLFLYYVEADDLELATKEKDPVKYYEAWKHLCSAQNVLGWHDANSTEFMADTPHPVVIDMPEHNPGQMGGTMRLGLRQTIFTRDNSLLRQLYGNVDMIQERHRHRYEVNPRFIEDFQGQGLTFVGQDSEGIRMEAFELPTHPYYVGVQFHPEYISRPLKPSPPYLGFILASVGKLQQYLHRGCRLSPRYSLLNDSEDWNPHLVLFSDDEVYQLTHQVSDVNLGMPSEPVSECSTPAPISGKAEGLLTS
ncbi:unnamed protein product [Darwinula stevensoni]|uniref:CTP synthase n=1 Tax=Darwinula stevensoni TaxID=69355 RepID=A0A7R8XCH4_9CRUS|nr:unnamed protein product [Darwinula stevensoni]CAG0892196.1 unnamed protein product [Darwinula stevensoni]